MARNIVFVGNCQANSMHLLFAASIAPITGDSVSFVPSFVELSENSGRLLMEADLVAFQILDSAQNVSLNKLRETREINVAAKVVEFPLVTGAFLWPHTGTKHPLNEALPFFPAGPFGSDFGDSFLNREISRGSDPAVALQKYLALDLGKSKDLDRLYELHRLSLQKKDLHSGFACADYIDTWFRKERLFQTPTVVSRRLYLYLASEIFNRLGIPAALVERACANTPTPYAAHIGLPLHPSIIRHFSLEYAKPTDRYHYYTDELFTFEQYAQRYLVYQFNKPLFKAIYAKDADIAVSAERKRKISEIRAGLSESDGSGMAYFELSNLLMLEGDTAASLAEIKRACEFDPSNVRYQIFFANILKSENELGLAEDVLLAGLIQWPGVAALWHSLAEIFRRQDRHDEATIAATRATEIEPYNPDFHRGLALSLLSEKKLPEALKAAQRAAALNPQDLHYQSLLGEVAMQAGDMRAAIEAFQSAAAISPKEPAFFRALAHCLSVKDQLAEAIEQMTKAVDLRPDNAENNAILAHFLALHGQIDEASPFLQRAIALAPGHLQYQEMAESLNQRLTASNVEHRPIPDEDGVHKVLVGKDGWLFLDNDSNQTLEQHKGNILFNSDQLSSWRQELQWRKEYFSRQKIPYLLLVAPNKESVYDNYLSDDILIGSVRPVDQFLSMANSLVPTCYPLTALRDQRDSLVIFDKVDTHWTILGALVACINLNNVHKRNYRKSLANFMIETHPMQVFQSSGDLGQKFVPERSSERVVQIPATQKAILRTDNGVRNHGAIQVYQNDFGNGKKCLIFGDSFGINLIQILKEYFTTAIFCHCSLIDAGLVEAERPDIVISEHVERFLIAPPGRSEGFDIHHIISSKRAVLAS